MNKDRFSYAKLIIFSYAQVLWTCLSDLLSEDIEQLMNMDGHGLSREELVVVLYELFQSHMLVAKNHERGLFTPTLNEVEMALAEVKDHMHISSNTFYGITTGCTELFQDLKNVHGKA